MFKLIKPNLSFLILIFLILNCIIYQSNATEKIFNTKKINKECNKENCRLPLCRCSTTNMTEATNGIAPDDTPMMVALSFNGILTPHHSISIKKILDPTFRNPNGCPIQASFFVADMGRGLTDYCFVQGLFNNQNEIGVSVPKYRCPYTDCESQGAHFVMWREELAEVETFEQKRNIANKAKINKSFLKGFRVPTLDQHGNAHVKGLRKYGFYYDSTVIIKPSDIKNQNGNRFWPHTLDFPPNYACPTCPNEKQMCMGNLNCTIQSVWLLPMHYFDAEGPHPCPFLIGDEVAENRIEMSKCLKKDQLNDEAVYRLLVDSFHRHYETNKAPFIINIETTWLDDYEEIITSALIKFVNDLTSLRNRTTMKNDIYFVTLNKIIEWMQYPVPLNVIASRWLWDCDDLPIDYDEDCDEIKKLISEETEKKVNNTIQLELRAEDLFRNGIFTAVIIVFTLSITFTLLYDRYNQKKT